MATPVPFTLHAIDRTRLSTAIVEQILGGIESGAFPPGAALPAERLLAGRLGVSRASVREAIRVLEHAGILDVRTGSGTYVVESAGRTVATLRARAALSGEHSPLDVVVARRAVEPACAELAAAQRHERDLQTIRHAIAQQAAAVARGEVDAEADLAFHLAVAEAARNPVLHLLLERLAEIMRRPPWIDLKHRSREEPGGGEQDVREHRAVLAAIERGDGRGAAKAMGVHLASVERDILAQVE